MRKHPRDRPSQCQVHATEKVGLLLCQMLCLMLRPMLRSVLRWRLRHRPTLVERQKRTRGERRGEKEDARQRWRRQQRMVGLTGRPFDCPRQRRRRKDVAAWEGLCPLL